MLKLQKKFKKLMNMVLKVLVYAELNICSLKKKELEYLGNLFALKMQKLEIKLLDNFYHYNNMILLKFLEQQKVNQF